ncbi:ABC transporter substrate-binding protein [Nocardioides sp. Bht2]|uniref:ABC transporter substrate-binding protein n=1 Tax=Nocardioides sp. Bht2 TaxID=3392297 RepID=UPI0039B53E22
MKKPSLGQLTRRLIRRPLVGLSAAALVVSMTACGGDSGNETSSSKLNVGTFPIFVSMPIWVAQSEGFFKENDLDVKLTSLMSGPTMLSALNSKSIDVMINGGTSAMSARAAGQKLQLLTPTIPETIYTLIAANDLLDSCAQADQPYPKPIECLKGKKLGVAALGAESHTGALSLLKDAGLSEKDVTFVPAGGGEAIANALKEDQVDAFIAEDTAAAYAVEVIKVGQPLVDLKTESIVSTWLGHGAWALEESLTGSSDKMERFADSIADAIAWLDDPKNSEKAAAIFKKNAPTTNDGTIAAMTTDRAGYFGTTVDCATVDASAQWLTESGLIPKGQTPGKCADIVWENARN